ncbi:helix-turn-helix domain-containing protein [Francisella orientalis]|uniref:Helix-turn-helix domain-containing protein n=1 Tax=Francisella orientalis TaxID=299583 RepID=A0AAW9YMH4_9GAMM|nr:helix-turn-helix domain-containing protein [Francisella orientalis]MBK2006914.1 helix-turn-helix domain-containing protein [Francisella orientalis]MBK2007324.1 helix-turn-helix domain-containing protein [Francisella orientalis]MBK2009048.1 helix-turn-helix domain-containing protein [Francisella orientalis]MBK2011161.1 helix-turn-helix domain-containing protein [Francisella orientalis]
MKIYKQIGAEERVKIIRMRGEWKSVRQIACVLKRCPSTISRELRRN